MRWSNWMVAVAVLVVMACAGCGPYKVEKYVEIGPNETAFVIPMEGATSDQAKAESEEFLKKHKVFTKRITLAQREKKMGRTWGDFIWVPTDRVIRVDRAPVTREWTADPQANTPTRDDRLEFDSLDGIGFSSGFTFTAEIQEPDTERFVYRWGGDIDDAQSETKRRLEMVIDTNCRSFVQTELQNRFGQVMFSECMKQKTRFVNEVFDAARKEFKDSGITVSFFGMRGGLDPENPEIQRVLDRKFQAENEMSIALNETAAQAERNKQKVSEAKGQADMAIESARGQAETMRAMADAKAYQIQKEAEAQAAATAAKAKALEGEGGARLIQLEQVQKWTGVLPQWLFTGGGGGLPMLLNMPAPAQK